MSLVGKHWGADLGITAVKTLAILALSTLFVLLVPQVGPAIEARKWPVYSNWKVIKTEATSAGVTRVWVQFQKVRPCTFASITWLWGDPPSPPTRVELDLGDPDNDLTRPLGWHTEGPWTVGLPEKLIHEGSLVVVHHQCHALWRTDTQVLP